MLGCCAVLCRQNTKLSEAFIISPRSRSLLIADAHCCVIYITTMMPLGPRPCAVRVWAHKYTADACCPTRHCLAGRHRHWVHAFTSHHRFKCPVRARAGSSRRHWRWTVWARRLIGRSALRGQMDGCFVFEYYVIQCNVIEIIVEIVIRTTRIIGRGFLFFFVAFHSPFIITIK